MSQAAQVLGLKNSQGALELLRANGVPLRAVHARAYVVEETLLGQFMETRRRPGRPPKTLSGEPIRRKRGRPRKQCFDGTVVEASSADAVC